MRIARHLLARPRLAALICALALLLKLAIPGGYMVGNDRGWPSITLCPQAAPMPMIRGDHRAHEDHGKASDSASPELPCAFAGFALPALNVTDPIRLAALLAFVLVTAFVNVGDPLPRVAAQLRPPPRGPPALL